MNTSIFKAPTPALAAARYMLLDLEFLDNILKWTNRKIEDANETAKKGGSGSAADSAMKNVTADDMFK